MASPSPLAPELECQERFQLIQQLSDLTKVDYVDSATYALLWFADLDALRILIRAVDSGFRLAVISTLRNDILAMRGLKMWLSCSQAESAATAPDDPTESTDSPVTESPAADARSAASRRDNDRCAVTRMGEPVQVYHIFPSSLGQTPKEAQSDFWTVVQIFWSPQTIAAWQRDITKVCQNMLTRNTLVHELWGKACFAFEPVEISEDRKTLTMRFWWLPLGTFSRQVWMCDRPSLPSDLRSGPRNSKLWDCDTDAPIYSGHLITLTTEDPETMPLPSFELLHMQWVLNRVAAIAGAADITDEELKAIEEDYYKDW
jgi:hypothetical protein